MKKSHKPKSGKAKKAGAVRSQKTPGSHHDYEATPQGRGHVYLIWADTCGGVHRNNNTVDLPRSCSPAVREKFWRELQQTVADAINAALDAVEDGGNGSKDA